MADARRAGGGTGREKLTGEAMKGLVPLADTLGLELVPAEPGRVEGRLTWCQDKCTGGGALHDGTLIAMADTFDAVCAQLDLPLGATTGTIGSTTNFFVVVRRGRVDSASRPLHAGRSTIVVHTDLFDADGRLVAQTSQTQAVFGEEGARKG